MLIGVNGSYKPVREHSEVLIKLAQTNGYTLW